MTLRNRVPKLLLNRMLSDHKAHSVWPIHLSSFPSLEVSRVEMGYSILSAKSSQFLRLPSRVEMDYSILSANPLQQQWCETTTMGCLASISNQGKLGLLDHYLPWQNRFVTPLTHSMTHKTHWSAKPKFLIISSRKFESTMLNALVISILKATFLSLPLALHLSWWIISIATNTLSKIERSSINTNYSSYTHFVMIVLNLFKKNVWKTFYMLSYA